MTTQSVENRALGPFTKGVVDTANAELRLEGTLRWCRNGVYSGVGKLEVRLGDEVAMTLMDDGVEPAPVTSVIAIEPFGDGALAVAHSTVTDKVYLYRLTSDLDGWYDNLGVLTPDLIAFPVGVLWDTCPVCPAVSIAEGLGVAYIAHNAALTAAALLFATRTYELPGTIDDLEADLDGTGDKPVYFLGVASYNQHLFGFGFNKSAVAATAYRPELIRHSAPNFGGLDEAGSGSITVGHAVRSARERVTAIVVAGGVCYFGLNFGMWGLVGEGRDSFQKVSLAKFFGLAGLRAACEAGGVLYGWSHRGFFRVRGLAEPEPLWDAIQEAVASVPNAQKVVVAYNEFHNQVAFLYERDGAQKAFGAFDVNREVFLGPDSLLGVGVACAGVVSPVFGAAVAGPAPIGAPTTPSTTDVGTTVATAHWTPGDTTATARTIIELRRTFSTEWEVKPELPSTTTSLIFAGLTAGSPYEWRVRHVKNGQYSAYLGPEAGTTFTTQGEPPGQPPLDPITGDPFGQLNKPTNLVLADKSRTQFGLGLVLATWVNSGETDALTEVYLSGPSDAAPDPASYVLVQTMDPGVASYRFSVPSSGTYWVRIRHVKASRNASLYEGPVSVVVAVGSRPAPE